MNALIQGILVGIILAIAAIVVLKRIFGKTKNKGGDCMSCSLYDVCNTKKLKGRAGDQSSQ